MRLEEIRISNFCSCRSVRIPLSEFNPLIGYNNSGKSNVLRAVAWLLRKSVLPRHLFWDPAAPIIVEAVISAVNLGLLPPNQQAQANPYVANGCLRFRRRQDTPSAPLAQVRVEVLNPTTNQWDANPLGLDNAIGVLFPEPIYIEAMEDAAEEVSKFSAKNTIGLLLKYVVGEIRANNQAALATIQNALGQVGLLLNGPDRIQQLLQLEEQATQAIEPFFPGLALQLSIDAPALDDLLKGATVTLSDGMGPRPFTSFGHGAQRSVHMALVKLLASYSHTANGSTVVLLIDEPELYLHPQAVEVLRESLKVLASQGFQVIFSTHSPLLIGEDDALRAILVTKDPATGTSVRERLADAAQVLEGNPHQRAVIFSIQQATYLLFSETVLIVEGKTERTVVPAMFQAVRGHSMGAKKVSLLEAASSSSIVPMMRVLRAVGFAPKAVADLDFVFKIAPAYGLVNAESVDWQTCKNWFAANTAAGFAVAEDGLPTRRDAQGAVVPIDPAAAFELMAAANPLAIANLTDTLLAEHIWVWRRGAIEAHLGIEKNEAARVNFASQVLATASVAHATHPDEASAFANWI